MTYSSATEPPDSGPMDADAACQVLLEAAGLIREDPNRRGSLLEFGNAGQLVMTGDMHGNLANFRKLQRFCNLESSPARYVVLHELIHRDVNGQGGPDTSIDLLVRAAAWKCAFPDNVFFMLSNHELAQLRGQEITKGGRSVLHEFEQGVALRFGGATPRILAAVNEYIRALPLAARAANGVFLSHSLPDPFLLRDFDFGIFERTPTEADLAPGGAAYALVWGRFHTASEIAFFAERVQAKVILVGHTPQEDGYALIGQLLIVASDHNHGVFVPIDLTRSWTAAELEGQIRKFVSVA